MAIRRAARYALLALMIALGAACAVAEEPVRITVSFAGDCTLGAMPNQQRYEAGFIRTVLREGMAYPFSGVLDVFAADDLTLVNLEGTFTNHKKAADKAFVFRAPPAFVQTLMRGAVEAVNIANNHIDDFGPEGRQDTLDALRIAGIVYAGGGEVAVIDVKGVRIGLCGYSYPHRHTLQKLAEHDIPLLKKAGCDIIIFSMHAGTEEDYTITLTQRALARGAIDLGADIVIGHHPHVIHGVDAYGGRPIFYSLGNFAFGGNLNPGDWDTMIGQVVIEKDARGARPVEMRIIPCVISASARLNDFRPVVAEGDRAQAILRKIGRYSRQLDPVLFETGRLVLEQNRTLTE